MIKQILLATWKRPRNQSGFTVLRQYRIEKKKKKKEDIQTAYLHTHLQASSFRFTSNNFFLFYCQRENLSYVRTCERVSVRQFIRTHPRNGHRFSSNQNTWLFIQEPKERARRPFGDPRNLGARDRDLSDYYSESSILESSARR